MVSRCLRLFSLAALVGLACIDIGQIRAPDAPGLGAACETPSDCAEGTCLDGFCCGVTACPACQVCGRTGRCEYVPAGVSDPHFWCDPGPSESCGQSGACDGHGA